MDNWVYYEGASTKDFDILASWFYEVYGKMLRLEEANKQLREANEQYREDMNRVRNLNKNLENEITELKAERSKTKEVLKRYCGSLVAPIPTIVGLIIDDYFYQKAETECQVKELQKAEKTIDKLNKELVEYADKVEKLEKKLWDPEWCRLIDKLNEIIDKEAPRTYACRKVYTNAEDEIWDKLAYLARSLCARKVLNDVKNKHIRELENKVNELDVLSRKLKLENEKLNKELEERKNDSKEVANNILKSALEFCQREASFAREHAHNVEVNAERARRGLD